MVKCCFGINLMFYNVFFSAIPFGLRCGKWNTYIWKWQWKSHQVKFVDRNEKFFENFLNSKTNWSLFLIFWLECVRVCALESRRISFGDKHRQLPIDKKYTSGVYSFAHYDWHTRFKSIHTQTHTHADFYSTNAKSKASTQCAEIDRLGRSEFTSFP